MTGRGKASGEGNAPQPPLTPLEIRVQLHPDLIEVGRAEPFLAELSRCIRDLLSDLAIPAEVEEEVWFEDPVPSGALSAYQAMINGQPVRHRLEEPAVRDPRELARRIAMDIIRSPELLLAPGLCQALQQQWNTETEGACGATMPPTDFQALLLWLAERGSRIDRVRAGSREDAPAEEPISPIARFERLIAAPDATQVRLWLSPCLHEQLVGPQDALPAAEYPGALGELLERADRWLYFDTGVLLPRILTGLDPALTDHEFRLQINDMRFPPVSAPLAEMHTRQAAAGQAAQIVRTLRARLREHVGSLLTVPTIECRLDLLREASPVLVGAMLAQFDVMLLTRVLRELVAEGVSIFPLRRILESLLELRGLGASPAGPANAAPLEQPAFYTDWVRQGIREQICDRYAGGDDRLRAHQLDPVFEARLSLGDREPLIEEERLRFVRSVRAATAAGNEEGRAGILLTAQGLRRRVRQLLSRELPSVVVLSYQDLSANVSIDSVGRIEPQASAHFIGMFAGDGAKKDQNAGG